MTCAALLLALGLVAGGRGVPAPGAAPDSLADLPLTLAPAPQGPLLAVLLTGDGGFAPADKSLAAALVRRNVAVVALSSPRYLARNPTPDQAAGDLARILRHFLATWHRERVVIVGYSRGADIGPFMVTRLPEELRKRVALTALIGPGEWASFRHGLLDILHHHSGRGLPVSSEVARLRGTTVLCIYGSRDRGAICPALQQAGLARTVVRNGGHVVNGNEGPALANVILAGLPGTEATQSGELRSANAGFPTSAP
jgi:type IV secretory pathway VirJ component